MRLAIFGVGAMGSLFGARLASHADVTLIGHWPEQIAALRERPLRVLRADGSTLEANLSVADSVVGTWHAEPSEAGGSLQDAFKDAPADLALILVKASHTEAAAAQAAQILAPDGLTITLQNGIGNVEALARHVGDRRAALGTTTQGAAMVEPGVVKEGGAGVTHLAARPEIAARIGLLADLLERAGFKTEIVEDVSGLVWGKLAINAAINPLTALLNVPNGALLGSDDARQIMAEAAREVAAVAAAQGIALPFPDPAARAEEVAKLTGANISSMLQDIRRGAPTEIDAICGAVTREGARLGVPTPANALLHRLIKALETIGARPPA